MFRWLKRALNLPSTVLKPAAAESVPTTDLAALLRVFLVDKVQAEIEREKAQAEVSLRLQRERQELRAARAEAARVRNRTLKRDAKGRLMKAQSQCALCLDPFKYPFTNGRARPAPGAQQRRSPMKLTYDGEFGGVLHPEVQSGIHIFGTPMGTFEGHANAPAIFAEEARWRQAAAAQAAAFFDSYGPTKLYPNPFLGENAPPAPGQAHPVK